MDIYQKMDILKNHKNQINPVFRMFNIEFLSISRRKPASIMGPSPLALIWTRIENAGWSPSKILSPENIERTSVLVIINDPNVNHYLIFKLKSFDLSNGESSYNRIRSSTKSDQMC